MFTVYILKNDVSGRYYIGSTNDIDRRISEHNRGQSTFTKRKGVWHLVYREEYDTKSLAQNRERKIKSYKSGNAFKKLINDR